MPYVITTYVNSGKIDVQDANDETIECFCRGCVAQKDVCDGILPTGNTKRNVSTQVTNRKQMELISNLIDSGLFAFFDTFL